ncbi:MAG: methyltransferase domain-containing protein, partial [Vicinamibacterales bacterium]
LDREPPPSAHLLHETLVSAWPRLAGRITIARGTLHDVPLDGGNVIVSSHACGALTDDVLDAAVRVRARVAVLPCCQDVEASDTGGLTGWLDGPLAVDVVRVHRLREQRYRVWTQTIPEAITPKNRLLLGAPVEHAG